MLRPEQKQLLRYEHKDQNQIHLSFKISSLEAPKNNVEVHANVTFMLHCLLKTIKQNQLHPILFLYVLSRAFTSLSPQSILQNRKPRPHIHQLLYNRRCACFQTLLHPTPHFWMAQQQNRDKNLRTVTFGNLCFICPESYNMHMIYIFQK